MIVLGQGAASVAPAGGDLKVSSRSWRGLGPLRSVLARPC